MLTRTGLIKVLEAAKDMNLQQQHKFALELENLWREGDEKMEAKYGDNRGEYYLSTVDIDWAIKKTLEVQNAKRD